MSNRILIVDDDDIVRGVMEEFEVGEEQARQDLREFVSQLRAKGMVVTRSGGEAPEQSPEQSEEKTDE